MKCGLCKHWGGPKDAEAAEFRTCQAVKLDKDDLSSPSTAEQNEHDPLLIENVIRFNKSTIAVTWGGTLRTQDTFGCVLFEGRKDATVDDAI